ncbi:CCA tRNA nucleotidyltransferase [Oceaniglobus roseus]|uniref:CCA tRNA nucleotidyltransferase n=1 Tax=Oceaniglobus roseus TaxID=1737570 RepID=UPI000C7ED6F1|nr:CCA tRNA nucleotidyltransferase [Kandeliimicrobium roseum]
MTRLSGPWLKHPGTQGVLRALEEAGHPAYLVGGCVRDALMGRPIGDLDIATAARPERTTEICEAAGLKVIPTGIDHGTVTVIAGGVPHEVTTFRRDVETDGRHAVVAFTDAMAEDASRRDFTMNALYATREGTLHDPLDGLPDLRARRVRFIGEPAQRIAEDHLRILRFFRFHAWFAEPSEGLDPEGLAACAAAADGIDALSRERIGAEMLKLLAAPDPAPAVAAMAQAGILSHVLPGADPKPLAPLVHLEAGTAPDPIRRLAALGGGDAPERLRLSRQQTTRLALLCDLAGNVTSAAEMAWRHGADTARDAALLRAALLEQPLPEGLDTDIATGAAATFPVKAQDLMPAYQGKALGDRLRTLEARWIASGFRLGRDELLN